MHSLLHSLNRQQIKVLRKYLIGFSTRNDNDAKTKILAELLLHSEKKVPSLEECSLKIYNSAKDSRIEKLKSRLFNKVLESILFDINIDRRDSIDEVNYALLKVKKKSALFQTLRFSSIDPAIVKQVLDEVIAISKKYEFYAVIVDNLRYSKWMNGWKKGVKVFEKLNREIEFYEYCNHAVNRATDNYYRMTMMTSFSANHSDRELQAFLRDAIAEMKKDYETSKSAVVGYYLKLMEMAYFQNEKDYHTAREVGLELLSIVNNNISVYQKNRVGQCYGNIAECDLHIGQYEIALNNLRSAQMHFPARSSALYSTKQFEFYAYYYLGEIASASETCKVLLSSTSNQLGDFRFAKYAFFNASVQFKQGQYKDCLTTLSMKYELSKDKLGWELAMRMLRIMTLIEMGKLDDAQPLVGSLIKHIERNARKADVHQRDKMLARLFLEAEKEGFSFAKPSNNVKEMLAMLSETGSVLSWQPLSAELIPVHEWIAARYGLRIQSVHQKKEKPAKKALV